MISRIAGKLRQIHEQFALIENGGVSYEILLPSALADRLKAEAPMNEDISFETIYYIEAGDKKSSHYPKLVGFLDPVDREFFSLYTQVPGMGVKKALKSLILPINEIATAIENRDSGRLQRLPGVGGRLAEKIIAELHGKTTKFALAHKSQPLASSGVKATPMIDEAMEILVQLQYSQAEAQDLLDRAIQANPKIKKSEELIQVIFKSHQATGDED